MGVRNKIKDILKLSEAILPFTGVGLGVVPIIAAAEKVIPPSDPDDTPDELAWRAKMIPTWKAKCLELMGVEMSDSVRKATLLNKIDADWFTHYGQRLKGSEVEKLAGDVVFAVKADIAASV